MDFGLDKITGKCSDDGYKFDEGVNIQRMIKRIYFLIFVLFVLCLGCANSTQESVTAINGNIQTPSETPTIEKDEARPIIENDALRAAWQDFVGNGRHRIATIADMNFSETAKKRLRESYHTWPLPGVMVWGDLGYEKRIGEDHFVAIVVDIARSDSERFGLVIFSPPANKEKTYELNWLYKDRDLSRTTISRASGYLIVNEYLDDGSTEGCFVSWSKQEGRFGCK